MTFEPFFSRCSARSRLPRRAAALLLGISCLLGGAGSAAAQAPAAVPAAVPALPAQPVPQNTHLRYAVFIHGYHVVNAEADYLLQPWGYGVESHLYTAGLASWFLTLNLLSSAQGRFEGVEGIPVAFDNHGFSRGEQRHAHIEYDTTGPHVTVLTPPETGREPLPEPERRQAVDMLGFLATLTRRVATGQGCTFGKPIFDGVHLSYLDMHGPTPTTVPHGHHPVFKGAALRCDFMGRQIGGFSIGSPNKVAQSTPHPGAIWFVQDPQAGTVPVRIEFTHPKMGLIIAVMQDAPRLTPAAPIH